MSQYLRVLRHRDFRLLFLGQSASSLGDQVVIVALALYVTRRTGSATDLGIVLAAQTVPMIVLLLFGGVWADRWGGRGRIRIMTAADAVRGTLHAALAVSIWLGGASVAELVAIEALFGAARAFFAPAYSGVLPQTIPEPLVQDARALSSTTGNLAVLVGPALGAAMVLTIGAATAFALDALTFAVSAALLIRIHPRARGAEPARESVLSELRAGWREVACRPWVWATIAAFTGAVMLAYAQWYTLAPALSRDLYGSVAVFGVLESVTGGGAVLGALIGIRWRPARPLVIGLVMLLSWPALALAFSADAALGLVIALSFSVGVAYALFEVWWETALARHIPPHALSRVSAYDWMGSLALLPVGFAIAGPLAARFGARPVLAAGGAATFVLLVAALLPRSTRSLAGEPARRRPSTQQTARHVAVEAGRQPQVTHVDPLVGAVDQRRGVQ